jgi:(R,R)-butanediol dehydrogenase/meso-butanediol dehydrogenase/diacetyl reductase
MRALVFHGRRDVRVEERPTPEPVDGCVLVEVLRCGICGTDASEYVKGPIMLPSSPTVLGHEFIGVVRAGDGLPEGTRVASGAGVSCGCCARCVEGRTNLCDAYSTLGLTRDGGLATHVLVPLSTLHPLPAGLPDDLAGLAQPLAVGLHAVARAGVSPGDVVVLQGAGAIGTFVLLGLVEALGRNGGTLVVTDPAEDRRSSALGLGAGLAVSPASVREAVLDLTDGRGADVVFETSGAPGSLQRAVDLARRGGRVLAVGLPNGRQELDVTALVLREVDIRSSVAHVSDRDLPAAIRLLDSRRPAIPTTVMGLAEVESQGLIPLSEGRVHAKILVNPAQ